MDEDQILQSIIADPDVVDPTIDVSKLRKTTPTSPRLLGNVSGIAGLRFDPTRTDYVRDLYSVYGGGLPTIDVAPVVDTTTPTVDTTTPTVDIGGGGGDTDQVASVEGITPTETITQPSFDDQFQSIEDIGTPIDVGFGEGQVDPRLAAGLEGPIVDTSPVTPTITAPSGDVFAVDDPLAEEKIDFTPETQGLVDQAFSKVGSTASDIMNDLSQIPGAIADFANQTVDIAGQKINVGKTLLKAGINKIVGGPISLVFDALSAIAPQDSLANTTTRNIVDELKASGKDYGFNMQSGNLNQDPFGRNPISAFGDYEQTLINDINNPSDTKMGNAKKEFAQDYFNAKAVKAGGVEVDKGTVLGPGEALGDLVTAEELAAEEAAEARKEGLEELSDIYSGIGQTRDAPSPTPQEIPDRGRGDGRDTGPTESPQGSGDPYGGGEGGVQSGLGSPDVGEVSSDAGFEDSGPDYSNVTGVSAPPSRGGGSGGSPGQGGGSPKIVCTMMNESYGFGSFRNKIWLKHSKDLAPEYQIGYHKIFLPLVRLSKTNKLLKKTLEHIAVHRTIDIRQEARGKKHLLGRVYRKILEPICYVVGKYAKR